jgi:hypothetical protein
MTIDSLMLLDGYQVRLRFDDGVAGELALSAIMRFEGVFVLLKDLNRFHELRVHPDPCIIYWPNGAGLDPSVLYAHVIGRPIPTCGIKTGSR